MLDWFRGRGNAETGPRDGEAPVLEQMALSDEDGVVSAAAPRAELGKREPRDRQRDIVLRALSEKVLNVHLANRFQTSYPLVLNLRSLEPEAAGLLCEVAAAALRSDPRAALQPDAVRSRLVEANAGDALLSTFERALASPRALSLILAEVIGAGLAAHAYAVSLIALGRPSATGRHHLSYIAARLALGEEIVGSLKRRYQR